LLKCEYNDEYVDANLRFKKMNDPAYKNEKKEGKLQSSLDKKYDIKNDKFINKEQRDKEYREKMNNK